MRICALWVISFLSASVRDYPDAPLHVIITVVIAYTYSSDRKRQLNYVFGPNLSPELHFYVSWQHVRLTFPFSSKLTFSPSYPNPANGPSFPPLAAQFFKRNPRILLAFLLSPHTHIWFTTRFCPSYLLNISHSAPFLLLPYFPGPSTISHLHFCYALVTCLPTSACILFPCILRRVDRMMLENVSLLVWLPWPFDAFLWILSSSSKSLFDTTCKTLVLWALPLPQSHHWSLPESLFPVESFCACYNHEQFWMFQHLGPHTDMDSCPLCPATSCLSWNISSSWKPSDFQVVRSPGCTVIVCLLSGLLHRHQSREAGLWIDEWTSKPIRECWVVRSTGNWDLGKISFIGARGCNHLCSANEPSTARGTVETGNRDFLLTRGRNFGTGRECLLMVESNAILIIAQVPHHSWCYDNAGLK